MVAKNWTVDGEKVSLLDIGSDPRVLVSQTSANNSQNCSSDTTPLELTKAGKVAALG